MSFISSQHFFTMYEKSIYTGNILLDREDAIPSLYIRIVSTVVRNMIAYFKKLFRFSLVISRSKCPFYKQNQSRRLKNLTFDCFFAYKIRGTPYSPVYLHG